MLLSRLPTLFRYIWLPVMLITSPPAIADSSPAQIMSNAMLSMMDTMGDLAHRYKRGESRSFNNYWPPYSDYPPAISDYPRGYYPGFRPLPYDTAPYYQNQSRSEVDGIWMGRNGEIVLVMYGYFRIYAHAETYQDGRYLIEDEMLLLLNPETGMTRKYQFVLNNGRMIMRDRFGNYLLFKQLPIPMPPYALIPQTQAIDLPEKEKE